MSAWPRIFIKWSSAKALQAYRDHFLFPFSDLRYLASEAVAKGTLASSPCDKSCKERAGSHDTHAEPSVMDVKRFYDAWLAKTPVSLGFAEWKFDEIEKYVAELEKLNPSVDISAFEEPYEAAANEFGRLKSIAASDYRPAVRLAEDAEKIAKDAVVASLIGRAGKLIAEISEEDRSSAEKEFATALSAREAESIFQLTTLLGHLEAAARLARWSNRRRETRFNRRLREDGERFDKKLAQRSS